MAGWLAGWIRIQPETPKTRQALVALLKKPRRPRHGTPSNLPLFSESLREQLEYLTVLGPVMYAFGGNPTQGTTTHANRDGPDIVSKSYQNSFPRTTTPKPLTLNAQVLLNIGHAQSPPLG